MSAKSASTSRWLAALGAVSLSFVGLVVWANMTGDPSSPGALKESGQYFVDDFQDRRTLGNGGPMRWKSPDHWDVNGFGVFPTEVPSTLRSQRGIEDGSTLRMSFNGDPTGADVTVWWGEATGTHVRFRDDGIELTSSNSGLREVIASEVSAGDQGIELRLSRSGDGATVSLKRSGQPWRELGTVSGLPGSRSTGIDLQASQMSVEVGRVEIEMPGE